MRAVYQSCGKLEIDDITNVKKITVKTHLPDLKSGSKYEYTKYYNISTKDYYGILGVLKVTGEANVDMTKYPNASTTSKLRAVDPNPIYLPYDLKPFGDNDFSKLTIDDSICFICFHDDEFDINNVNDSILKLYQENLPNCNAILINEQNLKGNNPKALGLNFEPMKGNGGILTVNGC